MAITTKSRKDLKSYFVKNAIPTESNFADLVDAPLNQADDGVFKLAGEPFSVVAAGQQKRVLRFYADYPAANPDWLISLNPAQDPANAATNRAGFGVVDGGGNTRLFLDASGRLGLGTNEPQGTIDARVGGSTNAWHRFVVTTTPGWGDTGSQHVTIGAGGAAGIMFANPHVLWNDNRASIRYGRTGGTAGDTYWDAGVRADGRFSFTAIDNGGAGEQVAITRAGLLSAKAGVVVEGGVAHIDRDGAFYRNVDGQVYITVDDLLYLRDSGSSTWAVQFETNTGTLNLKGALTAATGVRASGNGGVLDLEGSDHSYIQFYPQKLAGGRKAWLGYGGAGTTTMTVANDAGELQFTGTKVVSNSLLQAKADFDVLGSATLGFARTNDNFNNPVTSGCYQSSGPTGRVPDNAHPWVHLLAVRHSNAGNHHQLQIAASYAENDKLYFRKIARELGDAGRPVWNEVATAAAMPKIRTGTANSGIANGSGERKAFVNVAFGYTYASAPAIMVVLSGLDTDQGRNTRINVFADSLTTTGCRIVFQTWADSIVYGATATWIAVGV